MRQLWFGLRIGLGGTRDNVRIWSVSGAKDFSPRFGQVAYSNAVASCSSITRPRHCPDHIDQAGNVLRAAAFGLRYLGIGSLDVAAVRTALAPALDLVRLGEPLVAEFATHRLGPHSKGDDTRSAQEISRARAHDWYLLYAGEHPRQFARSDAAQRERVRAVVAEVSARPLSTWTGS